MFSDSSSKALLTTTSGVLTRPADAARLMPAIVAAGRDKAMRRYLEFFAVTIKNPNNCQAYFHACQLFLDWRDRREEIEGLADIKSMHVAACIRGLGKDFKNPTVSRHLAAIRMLFDWLATGQIVATIPPRRCAGRSTSLILARSRS